MLNTHLPVNDTDDILACGTVARNFHSTGEVGYVQKSALTTRAH